MPTPILHFYTVKPKTGAPIDPDTSVHVVAAPTTEEATAHLRAVPPIKGVFQARLAGKMGLQEFFGVIRGATSRQDMSPINTAAALRFATIEHEPLMTVIERMTVLDVADKIENRALAFLYE